MEYIEFNNIYKNYGDTSVLKNMNLKIEKGSFVTLLGPSGCGKSTLLRCLAGLENISSGSIWLDGEDITNKDIRKRNISMVFQQYSLFPNMTVQKNLEFGLKMQKIDKKEIKKRVEEALEMVDLSHKKDSYPSELSGGQQQRIALARAVVMRPKVLLLDEPLSAIDAKMRKSLQKSIREIHDKLNLTTIFVTHDQDEAMILSDKIFLLNNGIIEQSGDPISIYTNPNSYFSASFLGNYNLLKAQECINAFNFYTDSDIAIRPETISISNEQMNNEDDVQVKAEVIDFVVRGNVLRYKVKVNNVILKIDTLFRSFSMFDKNQEVYISFAKHNCIAIKENNAYE